MKKEVPKSGLILLGLDEGQIPQKGTKEEVDCPPVAFGL